jgi:hypothetical protein
MAPDIPVNAAVSESRVMRLEGLERFIYSLLRTAIYDYSGALFCQRCRDGQADSGRRPRNQSSLVQHTKCEYSNAQVSALLRCEPFTVWGNQWITLILDK